MHFNLTVLRALTQEPESSSVMMNLGSAYLGCEKYEVGWSVNFC